MFALVLLFFLLNDSVTPETYTYCHTLSLHDALPIFDRLLYTDIKTYLVELLMKQDQMSMSASIESRVPFLDHVLVEFAARLPRRLKLKDRKSTRLNSSH